MKKKQNVTRHVLTHLNIPFEPVKTLYMFINTSLRCHDVMISSLVWIDITYSWSIIFTF